jgi:GT2 family glycosyltransferase
MNSHAVCAVVLNWNGTKDTLECLDSLSRLHTPLKTVVVVDNGSDDNPEDEIVNWAKSIYPDNTVSFPGTRTGASADHIPAFVFLQHPINAGYAGGNNVGIQYAMAKKAYDFIWILNNDTVVDPDSLGHLLDTMKDHPEAGIAGSTVVYFSEPDRVQCAGGCRYNPWTTVYSPIMANRPLEQVLGAPNNLKMDYVYGAAMFVRASVFEKCGMFNEDYFLFYEEIDFCKKALSSGAELLWCPKSIVYHKCSQSVGSPGVDSKARIAFVNYHETLSALLYARTLDPWIFMFSFLFRFFGKAAVIARGKKIFLIKPLMDAYRDFFKGRNQKAGYGFRK